MSSRTHSTEKHVGYQSRFKTIAKAERTNHVLKHIDSPRPLQLSKSDKPKVSGLDRSFPLKDTPRFSYDGRESRDTWKTAIKLKEIPRLSLDSRQSSISRSASESRSNYLLDDREQRNVKSSQTLDAQQEPGSNNRRTFGVVAKLMGLEAFPDSMAANNDQIWMTECRQDEDLDAMSTTSRKADESKHNQASTSPRTQRKPSPSPQLRNTNYIVKPNSAFPLEPAPWRKTNGNGGSGKPASMFREAQVQKKVQNSYPSVYGQIEKRSTEIEFKRSGKDLREAMRKTRECLKEASDLEPHTRNDCTDYHKLDQNSMSRLAGSQQNILLTNPTVKGIGHLKNYESSGVFTKQAKVIQKTSNSRSSVISIEGMSSLDKLRTRVNANNEWNSVEKPSPNNLTPRSRHFREPYCQPLFFMEKSSNAKICKPIQTSKSPQTKSRDDPTSSGRSSTTVSPRLQQRKHGIEKQSSPTTKISDSSRFRRHLSKQQMESGSPSTKSKQTSLIELSSEAKSKQNPSTKSKQNPSIVRSNEIYGAYPHHCQRNNIEARLSEDRSKAETTTANLEQPSPVSVLDATFDGEGSSSPVEKTSNAFKDESQFFDEAEWNPEDLQDLLNSTGSKPGSYFVQEQSENVKHLVHKLGQVNSIQDVPATEYVSSLCKNTNPAHKYITEILLASRLPFTDLVSSSTLIQPHPSCHLINPKLFFVLEQTKLSDEFSDGECTNEKMDQSKVREKINRKLIFDTVNEILFRKLSSAGYSEPWICPSNLGVKSLTGQKLLKEVCSEVDQLLAKPNCSIYDADDASISVLSGDMMFQTPNWEDSHSEIPGMVLDIERMIFKDLISEVRSSWAIFRLLWKAVKAFTASAAAAKEFRSANAKVNFLLVEENRNLGIKKGNCNQSPSTVTTAESSSWDDCPWMFPDLNTSKQSASSSPWPIGLPDGGNVVLLVPLEQPSKTAAHAAKEDLCSPIESPPKKKMVRKSLKRKCRTMSVGFEDHRQYFGRRCEGTAKSLGVTCICMKHGINRKWARRKGYSLGGERTFDVSCLSVDDILDSRLLFFRMPQFAKSSLQALALPDGGKIVGPVALSSSELAATNNRAHYVRQDQNGYTTSHYEWKSTRVTSDRQGIAMSLCSVKDLYQHFGCKHKDVVKRLGVNVPMFKRTCRQHRIYCRPQQKPFDATNNRTHLIEDDQSGPTVSNLEKETMREASKRKCITKSVLISEDLGQHYGGGQRDAAKNLCDSLVWNSLEVLDVLPLWEESNTIEHLVPRRRLALQQRWIRPKKSLDLPRTLQMNCTGGLTVQSASSLDWPIGLPVGGHVVSLSKKIIVRKTFKRECRTISVSFEGHQQHFGSRCEDVANSPCVNRICEQHGISLVPTVKRIHRQHGIHRLPFRQGNSFGRERPVEVISVSTEEKLISRLQFLRMSLLGRSSLRPLALPSGSEFPRHIAFSSSELASTNNIAYPGRQDQCGSSASHIEKERMRETLYGEGTASHVFSFEHVQQHFGSKRKNDAKILGVCLSTFKRITRHHGIGCWPNQIRNNVWRSPDPHREKNLSPTFKTLSTNCPVTMENDMGCQNLEPNELLPDSFGDLNFQNGENGSLAEIEKTPTFHNSFSGNCCEADICLSEYDKTQVAGGSFKWAFQLKGLTKQFTANPNLNTLVFPDPQIASTEVLSENMGSSEDGTKLLASQAEGFLEGDVSECSNLTFPLEGQSMQATACPNHNTLQLPQPLIALTQILNENTGSSEDWIASQQEPFLQGHVSGSINLTVPTCLGPSPSQPMPTTPYTMHRVFHMLPPLTSSLDASSVKMKATYRDTIIEFQLPLASGSIELKEEVAKILKLEIDSFNVRYKDEEGEGDWILIPCDKDLRNYLQLFSSLVNPVIRLLVVDKDANLTNLDPMALKQPATFVESGIDPGSNGIVSDLLRFVSEKEICKKAGKAWTRSMSSIAELKNMLLSTPNRSLIAIQDIDHCAVMLPNLKNELTVSCLLKSVDGLFSRCGDERIIVFTTNHRDRYDAALVPLVNMDIYIPASSPRPIALPDGGEIVQLESSEQKTLVDFDATNNRECHSGILVSSSKNNNKREASKRLCMTESVLSVVDPTTGISLTEFDATNNGAHLVRACQGGSIMSNSEKKDTGEGLKGDFLTKSVLSLDDSAKQKSLPDCDATENEAHLFIAYQSCPVVSLLENRNRGEALKRECITKSILGLEDLQQHSGGRRDNAAKSFAAIYDPGIHTTNSLAWKSFEVVETLSIFWEQDDFVPSLSLRRLTLKGCLRKQKSPYLPRLLQIITVEPGPTKSPRFSGGSFAKKWATRKGHSLGEKRPYEVSSLSMDLARSLKLDCSGGLGAQSAVSLPDGGYVLFGSEKKIMGKTLKRKCKTMSLFSLEDDQQHGVRRWGDAVKSLGRKRICRQPVVQHVPRAKHIHRQHVFHRWPFQQFAVGLPDGGYVLSVSEKKIVEKTLKRKCKTMSLFSLEDDQQHGVRSWGDAVKNLGRKRICRQLVVQHVSRAKRIHRQHVFHRWPFQQNWETMKAYSVSDKRPVEVLSLSTDGKLVSRLQLVHISWLVKFLPRPSAYRGGGEIVGPIALLSSEVAATNNRAHGIRKDQSGSSFASHSEEERPGEPNDVEGTGSGISLEELQQLFDMKREDAAKILKVSGTTLKRICRQHGIKPWPYQARKKAVKKPPDRHRGMNTTGSSDDRRNLSASQGEPLLRGHVSGPIHGTIPTCTDPAPGQPTTIVPHPTGNLLASEEEVLLRGHVSGPIYGTISSFTDPAPSQTTPIVAHPTENLEDQINLLALPEEPLLSQLTPSIPPPMDGFAYWSAVLALSDDSFPEGHASGSLDCTAPTCSNPAPSQTTPTNATEMRNMDFVELKATYDDATFGNTTIKFQLPPKFETSELEEKVSKILKCELDSFRVEYKDKDDEWILMGCDENVKEYLQLLNSLGNQVTKLKITKVPNTTNLCETCGSSLTRKRPRHV
ncbi:hypothetical protein Vadar_028528 [Vaccinium darrowii]|uniref:Uncharacterized protein n=1 Tax=Vaccinium darrowii TaxID=229202 RepID=A0ACB7YIT3_9ERIC|nr:hypothetical protein Vadar_028528 [Vaccinium darrowii]